MNHKGSFAIRDAFDAAATGAAIKLLPVSDTAASHTRFALALMQLRRATVMGLSRSIRLPPAVRRGRRQPLINWKKLADDPFLKWQPHTAQYAPQFGDCVDRLRLLALKKRGATNTVGLTVILGLLLRAELLEDLSRLRV